jgi:ABC-type transport system involved in multi-copper enzyme maturation permease subunit
MYYVPMPQTSSMRLSFVRIAAIAAVELREIFRSHPFRIFVPAAALVVLAAPSLVLFAFDEKQAMMAQVGLSTALVFGVLLALVAGSSSLARERESGLRDLLFARSLDSFGWVIGKWVGITTAVIFSIAVLGGLHLGSTALRGVPAPGMGPLVGALVIAGVEGMLAGALALVFSAFLRPGPAFVASLLVLLAGHAVALLPAGGPSEILRFVLPRVPGLNLAAEAAFGPFTAGLWVTALLHGTLYSAFLLALAIPLARGKA